MKTKTLTEYTMPQGVIATKTRLIIPKDLPAEQWANLWQFLHSAGKALLIYKADALRHGRESYKEEFVSSVIGQTELPIHGIDTLELIGEIEPQWRDETLDQAHYIVAAKRCDTPKEREKWLNTAVIENLTPREMQASIRKGEVVHIDMEKRRVCMPSPYATQREFRAWRNELGDSYKAWSAAELREVADETLREQAEFYAELLALADRKEGKAA